MIILISGATHAGKTLLAQRLLETYHYPYLSIDHLKMGLIRSGNTDLTPIDDERLTNYLWPIVREIIKTVIENQQNLIVEGCYIPFDWAKDFSKDYLSQIHDCCLILSREYIETHFDDIRNHGSAIERRLDDSDLSKEELMSDNEQKLHQCLERGRNYILINDQYPQALSQMHFLRSGKLADMPLVAQIMVTSFRTAFSDFVTPQTMDACTDPDNCRTLMETVCREGKMSFLIGDNKGFLCWHDAGEETQLVALHSLPESWGTGLGHALLTEAFRQIGNRPIFLWAFKHNTRARRFYEKHGFYWDGTERISEFDSAIEVRYIKKRT